GAHRPHGVGARRPDADLEDVEDAERHLNLAPRSTAADPVYMGRLSVKWEAERLCAGDSPVSNRVARISIFLAISAIPSCRVYPDAPADGAPSRQPGASAGRAALGLSG